MDVQFYGLGSSKFVTGMFYQTDQYSSLLWVDRAYRAGEFSMTVPLTKDSLKWVVPGAGITIPYSSTLMIAEQVKRKRTGRYKGEIQVKGRDARIIMYQRLMSLYDTYESSYAETLRTVSNKLFISASPYSARNVPGLRFDFSVSGLDWELPADVVGTAVQGDTKFYDFFHEVGDMVGAVMSAELDEEGLVIGMRNRRDRSHESGVLNPVVYSFANETLRETTEIAMRTSKPTSYAVRDEQNWAIGPIENMIDDARFPYSGLSRIEGYWMSDLESKDLDSWHKDVWPGELLWARRQFAQPDRLLEIELEVDPFAYTIGKDYKIGDIITVETGHHQFTTEPLYGTSLVDEIVISDEGNGLEIYPRITV